MAKKSMLGSLMSTASSYLNQAIAVIQGDSASATAEHLKRDANAALSSILATSKGKLNDLDDAVADRTEDLRLALLNGGKRIKGESEREAYIRNITKARNQMVLAEQALSDYKEEIEFYNEAKDFVNNESEPTKGL